MKKGIISPAFYNCLHSVFQTRVIPVFHQWKIEKFAEFAERCDENWTKLSQADLSFYQFGIPVETRLDYGLQLQEQVDGGTSVVFFGERFKTPDIPELSDCTWYKSIYEFFFLISPFQYWLFWT